MTHYRTLGVPNNASPEDIKKVHRRLARKYHPDVSTEVDAKEHFQRVQRAYEVLSDPERRAYYDETGKDEKEDPEVGARDLLATVLKQTLVRTIDVPWVSMTNVANLILDEMQDQLNKQLAECRGILRKIGKHRGRMRTKEGVLNLHEAIVEAEEDRAKAMIANHPGMLGNIQLARKMLKDYESEAQEEPRSDPPQNTFAFRSIFDQFQGDEDAG
jgi:curved DNA-binding protein CbpA